MQLSGESHNVSAYDNALGPLILSRNPKLIRARGQVISREYDRRGPLDVAAAADIAFSSMMGIKDREREEA